MPYTCALDVADAYPDGLATPAVGFVLGATKQSIAEIEQKPAVVVALEQLREFVEDDDDDDDA